MIASGTRIAITAVQAMSNPDFVDTPGDCQMFAREVAEAVGGQVKTAMDLYRTGSAAGTLQSFPPRYVIWRRTSGLSMPPIQEGDFLYKGSDTCHYANGDPDPDGHVGIAVNGSRVGLPSDVIAVVENSSYHIAHDSEPGVSGHVQGAKGWRTLAAFGRFSGIVRLA